MSEVKEHLHSASDALWAKIGEARYLPLKTHLSDTAETMTYLWREYLTPASRHALCKSFENAQEESYVEKVLRFIAASHDLGKATPVFQSKLFHIESSAGAIIERRLGQRGIHLKKEFVNDLKHAEASYVILREAGCCKNVASIVGAHHGAVISKPFRQIRISANPECFHLEYEGMELWSKLQKEVLDYALYIAGFESITEIEDITFNAQPIITGLLIMADWLASNEEFFPLIPPEEFSVHMASVQRLGCADLGFLGLGWKFDAQKPACEVDFQRRFGFATPNAVQQMTEQIASGMRDPGIIVLEAEMGKGKTEAALAASELLASKFNKKGMLFALPSQSTSDGMFDRVNAFIQSYHTPATIRLVHGKAAFNKKYASFPQYGQTWDEEDAGSIMVAEWFGGRKKSLLADFVIGTIDQLLMAALTQKHVMLRHIGLMDKVVIIDEVHAYDAFMNVYLKCILSWLGVYHVPVVLLSATLPHTKKMELIKAYLGYEPATEPKYTNEYPRITYTDERAIRLQRIPTDSKIKKVFIRYIHQSLEETADYLTHRLSQTEGCIGVILNTVHRAQELYQLMNKKRPEQSMVLIHSGFLSADRITKEEEIRTKLGKGTSNRPESYLVIGTQVLEQSLDIDFDFLLTDHCPVDLLLQRIGRLHRHQRVRPYTYVKAECVVLEPPQGVADASKLIYGAYLLRRTKEVMPQMVKIPDDLSELVHAVYDNESDSGEDYRRWATQLSNKEAKAKEYRISYPELKHPFSYELSHLMRNELTALTESRGEARVRDTDGSVEVVLCKREPNGFSIITSGTLITAENLQELAKETVRLPYMLSNSSVMDAVIEQIAGRKADMPCEITDSIWLKNELLLPLDSSLSARLSICNQIYCITYDRRIGLTATKEG